MPAKGDPKGAPLLWAIASLLPMVAPPLSMWATEEGRS